jgi:hypothetical protein
LITSNQQWTHSNAFLIENNNAALLKSVSDIRHVSQQERCLLFGEMDSSWLMTDINNLSEKSAFFLDMFDGSHAPRGNPSNDAPRHVAQSVTKSIPTRSVGTIKKN